MQSEESSVNDSRQQASGSIRRRPAPTRYGSEIPLVPFGTSRHATTYTLRPPIIPDPHQQLFIELKRHHVGMIAVGGTIGFGLFLNSGKPLAESGPIGLLLGYFIMSTVMYAMIVSASEMVAAFPYSCGTIGLASYFVDPALAFAQGWLAWYHWSITIPVQIGWAISLTRVFTHKSEGQDKNASNSYAWKLELGLSSIFVLCILFINGLRTRIYGRLEFIFSSFKVLVIIFLVLLGFGLFVTSQKGCPCKFNSERKVFEPLASGPFCNWKPWTGVYGLPWYLVLFAAMMTSSVSFSGLETTAIVAGEVINATEAVPRIAKRTWMRVSVLYIAGILIAGLVVPSSSEDLFWSKLTDPATPQNDITHRCLSDGTMLISPPRKLPLRGVWTPSPFIIMLETAKVPSGLLYFVICCFIMSTLSAAVAETFVSSRYLYFLGRLGLAPKIFSSLWTLGTSGSSNYLPFSTPIPVVALLTTVVFSSLGFMTFRPDVDSATNREWVLYWMGYMTACAAMQSWITIMFTYIRFYYGVEYKRQRMETLDEETKENLEKIVKKCRHPYQPWVALYALVVCILILVFHGFNTLRIQNKSPSDPDGIKKLNKSWVIYSPKVTPDHGTLEAPSMDQIAKVVVNYLPLPMFFLLLFGYKLIFQTKLRSLQDMSFDGAFQRPEGIGIDDKPESKPTTYVGRFWWWLVS